MAYDNIEPIGDIRGDWQAGMVASVVANGWKALAGDKQQLTPLDFMPTVPDAVKRQTRRQARTTNDQAQANLSEFQQIFEATFGNVA